MQLSEELAGRLERAGQEHLCNFFAGLDEAEQAEYIKQLEALDLELLQELIQSCVLQKPVPELPDDITPAPFFPLNPLQHFFMLAYIESYTPSVTNI